MAKTSNKYVCTNCGESTATWSGRCPFCQEWNTLEIQINDLSTANFVKSSNKLKPLKIDQAMKSKEQRIKSHINEVDDVLGGGIVRGSINLLAGQPGIGKSTLLLQIAYNLSKHSRVLYISAEESLHQVGLRAKRLEHSKSNLMLVSANSADDITSTILTGNFDVVIVDSIQAITSSQVSSGSGSVSQITFCSQIITTAAKQTDTAVIIVGHVTKEGSIAGPKILEHAVDVVMQLEGDRYGGFKLLRANKNRYGSTNEAGIFEMTSSGLKPIVNPSKVLLSERQISDGSIILATMEGTRCLLVEVQALVNPSTYGYPKRTSSGFDINRLNLLIAVLEKRTKLKLADQDIYINIVGGMQIKEPAADLAICLAIGSAAKGMKLSEDLVTFGEVGLSGEVRHVPYIEKRLAESKKLGFKGAIGPNAKANEKLNSLCSVSDVRSALNKFLS